MRLVGAVLCEINDDWAVVRRYITFDSTVAEPETKSITPPKQKGKAAA